MKVYPPEHHSFGVSARHRPLSHPFHVRDSPWTATEPRYSSTKIKLGKQPKRELQIGLRKIDGRAVSCEVSNRLHRPSCNDLRGGWSAGPFECWAPASGFRANPTALPRPDRSPRADIQLAR